MTKDAFQAFRDEVSSALSSVLTELKVQTPVALAEAPQGMGDLAFACFPLAKQLRKAPDAIAKDIASRVKPHGSIEKAEAAGGYVNFHVRFEELARNTVLDAVEAKEFYGSGDDKKVRVLLEHTSANPTGPLHVGRARNPIIGDTMGRLLRRAGYAVTTEFYVNDVGRQVVIMTWGVKNLTLESPPEKEGDHFRYVLFYQQANKKVEEDPEVLKQVDSMLFKLEHGDHETVMLARETCERVLKAVMGSLERINIGFDGTTWESKFVEDGSVDKVIERLKASKYAVEEDDGAWHLDLDEFGIAGRDTKWVFTRADGTSLYTTRDLAYHMDKFARTDMPVNVLGEDQKLGQQQLAAALSIMGIQKKPDIVYYAFVSLPEGRMSTRKGTVVYIDDLMDEAVERAYTEVKARRTDLSEERMREIARVVGIGSLRYNIIRIQAEKQIVFKWEEALNFEGNSAPFVQYAHARACSILQKAGERGKGFDPAHLVNDHERLLAKLIARFPSVVQTCAEDRRAHPMAAYAQDLASQFNQFYRYVPVLKSEGPARDSRLALVEASMWTMRNALDCLGIEAPEEM